MRQAESYEAAHRSKETALADLRELEVRKRRGELVEAETVAREWAGTLRTVRAGVLAVASRVRARLPHLSAHDAEVIAEELRGALAMVAEGEDGARG